MVDSIVKRLLEKYNHPICYQAADAFAPYFNRLGIYETQMAMCPLGALFAIAGDKRPSQRDIDLSIQQGCELSRVPESVVRLYAEFLFGLENEAAPPEKAEANHVGGAR